LLAAFEPFQALLAVDRGTVQSGQYESSAVEVSVDAVQDLDMALQHSFMLLDESHVRAQQVIVLF